MNSGVIKVKIIPINKNNGNKTGINFMNVFLALISAFFVFCLFFMKDKTSKIKLKL
jgi:hypothetical protein